MEVTSVCNSACIYCPHERYKEQWLERSLSMEAFRAVLPAMRHAGLVFLQGWGEPLTHPRLLEMVRMVKAEGCAAGTTTNGTLLTRETAEALVDAGLDVLGFSLAGLGETNDAVRRGTKFTRVLKALETVRAERERRGVDRPRVHVAHMLLRDGLEDLERLPGVLASAGAEEAVVSSLSFVPSPDLVEASRLAEGLEAWQDLRERLKDVRSAAAARGLGVHFHLVNPGEKANGCSEGIQQALVVGADGHVSPCVLKNLPVRGPCTHHAFGRPRVHENEIFGHVVREGLDRIWHSADYTRFRDTHRRGGVPASCRHCLKRTIDTLS